MQPTQPKREPDFPPAESPYDPADVKNTRLFEKLNSSSSAAPRTPMRGRANAIKPPQLNPVYGDDPENDEPTHFTFKPNNDYLKDIFGETPVHIEKFKAGTCWQVWTSPDFPHLVIKTPNQQTDPQRQILNIRGSLKDLRTPLSSDLISVLGLAGNKEAAFKTAEASRMIVQLKVIPVQGCPEPVKKILREIALGNTRIQDFYPHNVGILNESLVIFDPDFQPHDEDAWRLEVKAMFISWSGGDNTLLKELVAPLPKDHYLQALL